MLLRYGVSNLLSVRDYQTISLIATSLKEDRGHLLRHQNVRHGVLPFIAIYGANAAGKTNVLRALDFMRNIVRLSHIEGRPRKIIRRPYFRLAPNMRDVPTQMDCDIIARDIRYHYGFQINHEKVLSEWLYAYPHGKRQVIFHRESDSADVYFGPEMTEKAKARQVEGFLRPDSLYLSVAATNNLEAVSAVYDWFDNAITEIRAFSPSSLSSHLQNPATKDFISGFLTAADPNIAGTHVESVSVPEEAASFRTELISIMTKHLPGIDFNEARWDEHGPLLRLQLFHRGEAGEVRFDLDQESDGTQRLLQLLGPVIDALANGAPLVVDGLEKDVHVLLAAKVVELFGSPKSNTHSAQLLFATHDTNLLSTNLMRRDQVWFAEKSALGATVVYSLSDLSVRATDSFERGYLQGRFGAIPFANRIDRLFDDGIDRRDAR